MKELDFEVPSNEVFEKMKKNTFNYFHKYSYSIIDKDYILQRESIFKIIHKISLQLGFKSQTFFLSAYYLDIIFLKKKKFTSNIYKMGLACLCLASKFCENDPMVPHLKYFVKLYNNIVGYKNMISTNNLMISEVLVCKLLNYKLNYFTIYDYNTFFFSHGLLKFEQLLPIEDNSKISYKNKKKEEKSINSYLVKNILGKIYKKSRYFLDNIIKTYEICIKYSPLYVSLLIMKKSIEEVLKKELNIDIYDEICKKEFHKKNNECYKEIMNECYKLDYESNEQYQQLLIDPLIQNIFSPNKRKISKNKNIRRTFNNKNDKNFNNFRNLSRPRRMVISKEKNKNSILDIEYNNNTIFTNSVTNGFYQRLKLRANHRNTYNNSNERNTLSLRKSNNIENAFDVLQNIKKLKISGRIREDKSYLFNDTYKSLYNSTSNNPKLSRKIFCQTYKSHNNSLQRFNTLNNFNNSINNSEQSIKLNKEEKTENNNDFDNKKGSKNKNIEKRPNIPYETIYSNDNFNNYVKINKYIKNIKINTLYENTNINSNNNNKSFNSNNGNNNIKNNDKDKDINYIKDNSNIKNDKDKKAYIKKLINIRRKNFFGSSKKHLSKVATTNNFYKNNSINTDINSIIKMNSNKKLKSKFNSNEKNSPNKFNFIYIDSNSYSRNEFKKINSFYNRIKLKQNNDNDITNNANTYNANDNNINILSTPNVIYSELTYKKNNINFDNKITSNISNHKKKPSYLNENIISTNDNIIDENKNIINSNNKENNMNKYSTSEHFFPDNTNINKIYVNTSKNLDMKNNNLKAEKNKKLSYLVTHKNWDINNTLKDINKAYTKNINVIQKNENNIRDNEITVNILNKNNELNKYKKVSLSKNKNIRHKYLTENLNQYISNNDNSINNNEHKVKDTKAVSYIKNKRNNYCFFNKNISNGNKFLFKNNLINNSINNSNLKYINQNISGIKERENKNTVIPKSSIYQLINKSKNHFINISKEEDDEQTNEGNNIKYSRINFFKSQQNFYKSNNNIHTKGKILNIDIKKNNKEKDIVINNKINENKSKDNSYIKRINIKKLNIDNISCQGPKNSSTIIINNTININFGNKKNLNGEIINYKNEYKDNSDIPKLNFNKVVLNSENNQNVDSTKNMLKKISGNNSNRGEHNIRINSSNNIFHKVPISKKIVNKKKIK